MQSEFMDITAIINYDRQLRVLIKCDQAMLSEKLFADVVKPISIPPYSEYSIIILMLNQFVYCIENNRAASEGKTKVTFNFQFELNNKKSEAAIIVSAIVTEKGNRVLLFSQGSEIVDVT